MYNGLHVLNMTLMDDELMMKTICASCNKQIDLHQENENTLKHEKPKL